MRVRGALVLLVGTLGISPAYAESSMVPSLEGEFDVCVDRPAEPDWMRTIHVRDAYKRVLVQDIYRAQNIERIVALESCSCDTRFPTWEAAEAEFLENFPTAERWEMLDASDIYNQRANALRPDAMEICEEAGNW